MIPNKDQMNTTMPTNTGGGLGFIDKSPSPRPAPPELMTPSNASLMNGTSTRGGLGSTMGMPSMNTRPNPMPIQPVAQRPIAVGNTGRKNSFQGKVIGGALFTLVAGAGYVFYRKFTKEDLDNEMEE